MPEWKQGVPEQDGNYIMWDTEDDLDRFQDAWSHAVPIVLSCSRGLVNEPTNSEPSYYYADCWFYGPLTPPKPPSVCKGSVGGAEVAGPGKGSGGV